MRTHLWLAFHLLGSVVAVWGAEVREQLPEQLFPGLERVLERAMSESSAMRLQHYGERESDGRRRILRSQRGVRARAVLSARREEALRAREILSGGSVSETTSSTDDRLIYGLTVSKPLYHWGTLKAMKQIGEIEHESSQLGSVVEFKRLGDRVRAGYLDLIIARQAVAIEQQKYAMLKRKLEVEERRLEEGFQSRAAVGRLRFDLDQSEVNVIRKERDYLGALEQLARDVGVSADWLEEQLGESIPEIEALTSEEIESLRGWFDEGIESNETLLVLENRVEVAKRELHRASKRLWPNIDLAMGLSQNERDISGRRTEEQFIYAGINVNWNIFDGHETKGHQYVAVSRLQQAENRALDYREQLGFDMDWAIRDLDTAARLLGVSEGHLELARSRLDSYRQYFERDAASQEDVEEAEFNLDQQRVSTQQARAAYLKSLSRTALLLNLDPLVQRYEAWREE